MKDILAELLDKSPLGVQPKSIVREYLQARILQSLQRAGAMTSICFMGGTALRFLYRTPRYSEDLDFTLEGAREPYDIDSWLRRIRSDLSAEGYDVNVERKRGEVVDTARILFPGLLAELGATAAPGEKLSIRVEVDTNPPVGAGTAVTTVRRLVTLRLYHHDKASLLAGKLNAILTREWVKGRDLFDLVWYLSDPQWPAPNLVMLDNALAQFGRPPVSHAPGGWRQAVSERLTRTDWEKAALDVRPFLERTDDVQWVSSEAVMSVLD